MQVHKDVWQHIPGNEMYCIDIEGNVLSLRSGRILKPQNNGRAYQYVKLGGKKHWYVHRLQGCFIKNPDPDNKIQVDHIDQDRTNNHRSNLRWVTPQENVQARLERQDRLLKQDCPF